MAHVIYTERGVIIGNTLEFLNPAVLTVKGAIFITGIEKADPQFYLPPLFDKSGIVSLPYHIIHLIGNLDPETSAYKKYQSILTGETTPNTLKVKGKGKRDSGAQIINMSPTVIGASS